MLLLWFISFIFTTNIPYFDFSGAGSEFYGYGRELREPVVKTVRIGVMGPERTPEGEQLRCGVEIALEEANEKGGYRGIPYEMIFRPDDGPWGTASKQVVRLVYEDKVWTIIGGLDGHHTHLAELVVAKAWVPVVTPSAVDFTVDYANVPWVFRCMPDDRRQAELLLEFARKRGYKRVVVLTEIGREAHAGFSRLREVSWRKRYPLTLHLQYPPYDPEIILTRLEGISADAIIIWGKGSPAIRLLRALRKRGVTVPVLGPSTLATPEMAREAPYVGELIVAAPCDLSRDDPEFLGFRRKFEKRTGKPPSPISLFAYDAARLVIRAIERAGLNRARIRDELASSSFIGLTGRISFDSLGGNRAEPILMSLSKGRWVRLSPK